MIKRREFLKNSGALAMGGMLLPQFANAFTGKAMHPVGLQLFTLFNVIEADVPGNLKKIAAIGYRDIESAFSSKGQYYGYGPKEFAKLLRDLGLSWRSHHVLGDELKLPPGTKLPDGPDGKPMVIPPMKNLRANSQEIIDSAAEAGIPYLVAAIIPTNTLDETKSSIDVLNKAGEICKKAGITLAYHNHEMEFVKIDGTSPYDLMLSQTSPDTLMMELDLCWATKAGMDPVELFKKNPGRFPLWHVKDIAKDMTTLEPVGNGVIDFKRIFAEAKTAGMKHFFVEHDMPKDAFASISTSMENLRKML